MAQTENKRIAKNTLLLYFRSILLILVALYTSRVILDALGVSDYGIYNIVGGVVTSLSILGTAMASATQRFITFALGKKNPVHLKDVFQTSVTLHMVLGVITVVVLEIVGLYLLYYHLNIPKSNILYLKEGKAVTDTSSFVNTFGANVNDILHQSFFLENGFMGEHIQRKIQSMIRFLKSDDAMDNEWNIKKATLFINTIGDELVASQLRLLLAKKQMKDKYSYRSWLKKELERLKRNES